MENTTNPNPDQLMAAFGEAPKPDNLAMANSPDVASAQPQPVSLFDKMIDTSNQMRQTGELSSTINSKNQFYGYNEAAPYLQGFGSSGFVGAGSDEYNAENQRWYHQLTNGTVKGLGIAATTFVNGTIGFLDGIGSVIGSIKSENGFDLSKFYDNDTARATEQVNKTLEHLFPNYYSQKELNADALSTDNLLTMNFLADKLIKNAGFAVGAIGTGYAYGALGRAMEIGKLASQFKKALNIGQADGIMMSVGDDIANVNLEAIKLAAKKTRNAQIVTDKYINQISMTLSTMGEANMEALEGLNTVKERLISEQETALGRPLKEEEYQDIESRAKESANNRWLLNTALLNITNRIQLPKILGERTFAGQRTILNREVNDIAVNKAEKEIVGQVAAKAGETYATKAAKANISKWGSVMDFGKRAATTLISPSEMFEEGSQYVFQQGTSKNADYQTTVADFLNNQDHPEYKSLLKDMASFGIPQLFSEKEGIESLILGGLTGGLMETAMGGDRAIDKRKATNTQNFLKYLNENAVTPYMKERMNHGVNDMASEQIKADAIARNDISTAISERTNSFMNFAIPRLFYGRKDLAIEELMQYHSSRMGFDLAKEELGLLDSTTKEKLDKHITDSIEALEKVDKMLTHVEAVYPNMYAKDGTINPLAKGLLFATYKIDDFETRIAEMMADLTKIGVSDIGLMTNPKLRKEAGFSLEELRNKLNKDLKEAIVGKTAAGIPIDLDENLQKLNDIERLQNLRETYINDYNQIRKQEFLGNSRLMQTMLDEQTKLDDYLSFERHMWHTQRVINYSGNTDARLNAMKLSNALEKYASNPTIANKDIEELIKLLQNDMSYFLPEDQTRINSLIQNIKDRTIQRFNTAIDGEISDSDKQLLRNSLNGAPGSMTLEQAMEFIESSYDENIDNGEGTQDGYDALFQTYKDNQTEINLYKNLDLAFNNPGRSQMPKSKNENDIRRDIAKMFESKAELILSSYDLDKDGFDDVDSVEDAIKTIKNLYRIFNERENKFFAGNKAFGTKDEYLKSLNDLVGKLQMVLEESKKNAEDLQKSDNDFSVNNKAFKVAVVGWATNTDTPDNKEVYDAIANIIGKTEFDDLLTKNKTATDSRYAYEIYQLLRDAINKDAALGKTLQVLIDKEIASIKKDLQVFENKNRETSKINGVDSTNIWYNNIYSYYLEIIESVGNAKAVEIYKKSRNILDVIKYIESTPGVKLRQSQYTNDDFKQHLILGEKLRALNSLSKINNVSNTFSFVKYWQAVDAKMQTLKVDGIVPTMRQLQVIEDIVFDLFTAKDSTVDYNAWTYFNGRIGSGKTRVVASSLIDILKVLTSQSDANKLVYALGDKQVAGLNLESALDLKQTLKTDPSGMISGGRSIDDLIKDLNADADSLKQVRFILGDEFARPSIDTLNELATALSNFNKRNKKDLRLVAMGDTLQSSSNKATNVNIKTANPNISLTTELATSYRSPLFSINVVQNIFDSALNNNVLKSNPKIVAYKETNPDGTLKYDGNWVGVTGVEPGTSIDSAEDLMVDEIAKRSKARDASGKPITKILIITNTDKIAPVTLKLSTAGADMTVINVLTIEQAQGLSSQDVYIHLDLMHPDYKNGADLLKYNRDMYTALRATRYMHVTTLESQNISDPSLFTRYQFMINKMRNTNTQVKDDVANIKTHLETIFKVAPLKPTAASTTSTTSSAPTGTPPSGGAPAGTPPSGTPPTGTTPTGTPPSPAPSPSPAPGGAPTGTPPSPTGGTSASTAFDDIPPIIDQAKDFNISNKIQEEVDLKNELLGHEAEILDIHNQAMALAKRAETETDTDVVDQLIADFEDLKDQYADIVSIYNGKIKLLEETLNARGVDLQGKSIGLTMDSTDKDQLDVIGTDSDFLILNLDDTHSSVVSIKSDFQLDEEADTNEEIDVAFPTSKNFKTSTGLEFYANDDVVIIPVIKAGKPLYGIYSEVEYNGVRYFMELGVLSSDQIQKLQTAGILGVTNSTFDVIPEKVRGDINATLYKIPKLNMADKAVAMAKLRNMKGIDYHYNYATINPADRDGATIDGLLSVWATNTGIDLATFKNNYTYTVETMGPKNMKGHMEKFEKAYGETDMVNATPLLLGKSYIVIQSNTSGSLPQFIELEERGLALTNLDNPENAIIRDWYINPLNRFVEAIEEYDQVLNDVLKIDRKDMKALIDQLQYTIPGTSIRIVEDVLEFEHGNTLYNDLLYLFVNMNYNGDSYFKVKGNEYDDESKDLYARNARPVYDRIFKLIRENKDMQLALMKAARNVYKTVRGNELQIRQTTGKDKKDYYYDFTTHKQVTFDSITDYDTNTDNYIPVMDLKPKNVLGGAQMASNLIAFGNKNVVVNNPDGSTTRYSMGHYIKQKSKTRDKVEEIRYMGRNLLDRRTKSVNANKDLIFDNLFVNAVIANSTDVVSDIPFGGYQDRLIVESVYNELVGDREDIKPFKQFIGIASSRVNAKSKSAITLLQDLPEWEIFKNAVQYYQNNVVKVGHNVASIRKDILDKKSASGTHHQFGVRNYNGITRSVGLRMNAPIQMTSSKRVNWTTKQDNLSSFEPARYSPEDRFQLFFTSSFTGYTPSTLSIGFDGYDALNNVYGASKNPTINVEPITPEEKEEDPIVTPQDDVVTIVPDETPTTIIDMTPVTTERYFNNILLTPDEIQKHDNGEDIDVYDDSTGGYVQFTRDMPYDGDYPFLMVGTGSVSAVDNMPSGDVLNTKEEMFNYLQTFIPDITADEVQLLNDLHANVLFGKSGKDGLFGAFRDGIIYAVEGAISGKPNSAVFKQVLKHEAFHKIFRQYLTEEQRKVVIAQAREEYNLAGMNDKQVEEFLAVNFQKRPDFKRDSLLQRFLNFLRRLYYRFFKNSSDIESFFSKIEAGYFRRPVSEDQQYLTKEAAFLDILDVFKDKEDLINPARSLFNSALAKAQVERESISEIENVSKEMQIKNAPNSDFETVANAFTKMKNRMNELKSRYLDMLAYNFYLAVPEGSTIRYVRLTDQSLRNAINKGQTVYGMPFDLTKTTVFRESELIEFNANEKGYLNPLTEVEEKEFEILQILFNQFITTPDGQVIKSLQGSQMYPNFLVFIKSVYPNYFDYIKAFTNAGSFLKTLSDRQALSDAQKNEVEKKLNIDSEEAEVLDELFTEKVNSITILSQILDKEGSVNPNRTVTENVKTWLGLLFVRNYNNEREPINVKQALAILYNNMHLFNARSYAEFEDSIRSNFGVENGKQNVFDEDYINDIITKGVNNKGLAFLKRLGTKYNVGVVPNNVKRLSELIKIELKLLVDTAVDKGEYSELATITDTEKFTIFDLYTYDRLHGGRASVMDLIKRRVEASKFNTLNTKSNKTDEDLVNDKLDLDFKNFVARKMSGYNRMVKFGSRKSITEGEIATELEETDDEFEARKIETKKLIDVEINKERQRISLIKRSSRSIENLKEEADKIRKTLKADGKRISDYRKQTDRDKVLEKLSNSGKYRTFGDPIAILLQNRLLGLAKYSYQTESSIKDQETGEVTFLKIPKHYGFIDDNTFMVNGVRVIRGNREIVSGNVKKRDIKNRDFFTTIWNTWRENTPTEEFEKHHVQMLSDLYRQFKANSVFLDIMTNFNNLTPSNLSTFEITRSYGVTSYNFLTKQADDTNIKLALNVSQRMIDMMTVKKVNSDGIAQPVINYHKAFKNFIDKNMPDGMYKFDKTKAAKFYQDFLTLLQMDDFYVQPLRPERLQKVNESIAKLMEYVRSKYNADVLNDEDQLFDTASLLIENRGYFANITRYINSSRSVSNITSVKDLNDKTRFFQDYKSFADGIVNLLSQYDKAIGDDKLAIGQIIQERYPHLKPAIDNRFNFMVLNPFNSFNTNPMYPKVGAMNKLDSEFLNLDGTLINDYAVTLEKENYNNFLDRMLNGHFIASLQQFVPFGGDINMHTNIYVRSDKPGHRMMPTGVYPFNKTGAKNNVKEMLRLMLVQRVGMAAERPDLKVYSPWKDSRNQYHFDGLQDVNKEQLDKLIALTGKFNSYEEIIKGVKDAGVDLDLLVDEWETAIKSRAQKIITDIQDLNRMSLAATKRGSLKYGVSLIGNIEKFYNRLVDQGLLTKEDFEDNPYITFKTAEVNGDVKSQIVVEGYNSSAKGYSVKDEHLKPLVELFYANVYINDFFLNQITQGDPAYFPDAVTAAKRLVTTHANIKSPLISPVHAPDKINTLFLKDIEVFVYTGTDVENDIDATGMKRRYSKNEFRDVLDKATPEKRRELTSKFKKIKVLDGGGYMTERARDSFNKGFGSNMQLGDSIKPLAHWFTDKGDPLNNKYALAVITDEYARKFPELFDLRLRMDFAGLSPTDFEEASKLEKKRLKKEASVLELRRLQELYDMADPIHQAAPESSFKYGLPADVFVLDFDYDNNRWGEFEFSNMNKMEYGSSTPEELKAFMKYNIKLNTSEWGQQLDPNDDVDAVVSLPTQLLYFANVNGNNPVETANIYDALNKLQSISAREFEELGVSGNNTTLEAIRKVVMNALEGKENHMSTFNSLSQDVTMINLPLYQNTVTSTFDNAFTKNFLSIKFKGTKGVQIPEALTEDYLGKGLNWDPKTQTAEAYMPLSYKANVLSSNRVLYNEWLNEKDEVKKLEIEKQILDSLPVVMMGFRIPTTGLNSAVRIKIKGFVNENTNRVILPTEVILRMGSDFDIDTIYIMRPELAGGNRKQNAIAEALGIPPNSPFGFDFEGNEITDFESRIASLRRNSTITSSELDKAGNPYQFTLSDKDIRDIERSFYKNKFAFNYMNIIKNPDNLQDVNKALNFDRAKSIYPLDDNSKSLYVTLAELKNDEFKMAYQKALESEDYENNIYNPDVASKLEDMMNKVIERTYSMTNLLDRAELQILNQTGKNLTGIFASISKSLAYIQESFGVETGFKFKDGLSFELNGIKYDGTPVFNNDKNRYEFRTHRGDFETSTVTFDELQWMVNAAVDNAKEQILAKLNINRTTSNVANGALTAGLPLEDLLVVLQQPVIQELLKFGKINSQVISYLYSKVIETAGVSRDKKFNVEEFISTLINSNSFSTIEKQGSINLSNYVKEELFKNRDLGIRFEEIKNNDVLNPISGYKQTFTLNDNEYTSLENYLDTMYLERAKDKEKAQSKLADSLSDKMKITGYLTDNFANAYEAYLRSFGVQYLNELNLIGNLKADSRFKYNKMAVGVIQKLKSETRNDFINANSKLKQDTSFMFAQLYALKMVDDMNTMGEASYKLQKILNLINKNPNGVSDTIDFEIAMAEIFEVAETYPQDMQLLGATSGNYLKTRIVLPAKAEDLKLRKSFAIQGFDISKVPLFKTVYENWYQYAYLPQQDLMFMYNQNVKDLVYNLNDIYGISPLRNSDNELNDSEAETLMRATVIKLICSKLVLNAPNDNGVLEAIPVDTIGKTYNRNNIEYSENRALYEELVELINEAQKKPKNRGNAFILSLSKEQYNARLRTGEIKLTRKNTSDDNEVVGLKTAFLSIDQDDRIEFMKNNPDYKGYWLSPLQKGLIKYAAIFEGLNFGNSKISLYLPDAVKTQFSKQLAEMFNSIDNNNSLNNLEHYIATAIASSEASWIPDMNYFKMRAGAEALKRDTDLAESKGTETESKEKANEAPISSIEFEYEDIQAVSAQNPDNGIAVDNPDNAENPNAPKEAPEAVKSLKANTVKYSTLHKRFYHLVSKSSGGPVAQPFFIKNEFKDNITVYYRLDINNNYPGKKEMDYFYAALPKAASLFPKIPDTVFESGFSLLSLTQGNFAFLNEQKSIFEENGQFVFYSGAGIPVDSIIHGVNNTLKGYLQNIQQYRVVSVTLQDETDSKEVAELYEERNRAGITIQELDRINAKIRRFQNRYVLEKVDEAQTVQTLSPVSFEGDAKELESKGTLVPKATPAFINNTVNEDLINGLMEYDRINNNGTFRSSVWTETELHLLNQRLQNGQFKC